VAHGDAHPGNLLWQRGRITGITDWQGAHLFPRGREVAYTRTDTAVLLGPRAADAYLEVYEHHLGRPVRDIQIWDLIQGLNAMHWSPLWAFAYREQGSSLTDELARRHAVAFVRRALKRVPAT
jgi:aminoglycoside phosphotransferase (APT) family kinase protein